jgi:hypothetical protein
VFFVVVDHDDDDDNDDNDDDDDDDNDTLPYTNEVANFPGVSSIVMCAANLRSLCLIER